MACGSVAARPGIQPLVPALEARTLNYWASREVLEIYFETTHVS